MNKDQLLLGYVMNYEPFVWARLLMDKQYTNYVM